MLREVRIRGADCEGERAQWGERKIFRSEIRDQEARADSAQLLS